MSRISTRVYEEALRDWLGDRAVFHPRWRTMDSHGWFNPVGVMHHWTAMSPNDVSAEDQATRLQYNGSLGLSAHLSPASDGRVFIIAGPDANANHAGSGDSDVLTRIERGIFDGWPTAVREDVDGNPFFYGLEYQYHPDDGAMPDEQVEGGILASAALCEAHGWPPKVAAGSNLDHFEWTPEKWDREVDNLAHRTREGVRLALEQGGRDMYGDRDRERDKKTLDLLQSVDKRLTDEAAIRTKLTRANKRLSRALDLLREAAQHDVTMGSVLDEILDEVQAAQQECGP